MSAGDTTINPPSQADDFFVGYLPTPKRLREFLLRVMPSLLIAVLLIGALASGGQHDPGDGSWNTDKTQTLEGVLIAKPYPMLRVMTADGGGVETILLVESGKHGATRAATLDGQTIRATGFILKRGVRRMLELAEGADALTPSSGLSSQTAAFLRDTPIVSLGEATLRGEIVDSKCFLGAMKPGEGKTHKECATLCITGGVPPMFMTRDAAGRHTLYLLLNRDGGSLGAGLLPLIADPVELKGELRACGDMRMLLTDLESIRRL